MGGCRRSWSVHMRNYIAGSQSHVDQPGYPILPDDFGRVTTSVQSMKPRNFPSSEIMKFWISKSGCVRTNELPLGSDFVIQLVKMSMSIFWPMKNGLFLRSSGNSKV